MLNTREAARFLRISEASIRRWSDAGLLPARRVGPRRERRFNESDLERFGSSNEVRLPAEAGVNVGGVEVPVHGHFATFYDSDAGRIRLTVPFLADGLRSGQTCFLVASGKILDAYNEGFESEKGLDVDRARADGRLVIVGGPGAGADDAIRFWERSLGRAIADGPTVVRIAGDMSCELELFTSLAAMMQYEVAFSTIAARFPSVTLCAYDVREFDGQTIFDAMRVHPDLFDQRLGGFLN
jgi:excisionase family DNA binding protein